MASESTGCPCAAGGLGPPSSPTPCVSAATDLLIVCAQTSSLMSAPPKGAHGMSLDSGDASACPLLQHDAAHATRTSTGISTSISPFLQHPAIPWEKPGFAHRRGTEEQHSAGVCISQQTPPGSGKQDAPTLFRTAPCPRRLPVAGLGTMQHQPRAFSFLFLLPMCSRSVLAQLGSGAHICRGCSAPLGPCHTHYFYNSQAGPPQLRAASPTCAACVG